MEHRAQEISESDIQNFTRREIRRFRDGTYKSVPVLGYTDVQEALEYYAETNRTKLFHFAHLSLKNMPQIAYTDNNRNGVDDRQRSLRIGRYLTRFCKYRLSEKRILELVDEHNAMFDVRESFVATTPDDIENVYLNGPNSCMSHSVNNYQTGDIHPVSIYGAGDVGVFYLKDNDGDISGRALVALKSKIHGRIYGDCARMEASLAQAGYRPDYDNNGFNGCKLHIMKNEDAEVIAPYFDGAYKAVVVTETDVANQLNYQMYMANPKTVSMLRHVVTYDCEQTSGLAEDSERIMCESCEDSINEDDQFYSEDGNQTILCQNCFDETHDNCDHCGDTTHNERLCWVESAQVNLCYECHDETTLCCTDCDETYVQDDLNVTDDDDDDGVRCEECHADHTSTQEQEEEVANEAA
jgi:hypothetical protein